MIKLYGCFGACGDGIRKSETKVLIGYKDGIKYSLCKKCWGIAMENRKYANRKLPPDKRYEVISFELAVG